MRLQLLNKKAVELSLNFIVILIISIIIFGFGVKFISDLSSQAVEITDMTISELDERIGDIICEGSERVCVGIDRKTIKRKESSIFGLKIINIIEPAHPEKGQYFDVIVTPPQSPKPIGFKKDQTPIENTPTSPNLIIYPAKRSVYIVANEVQSIGIGVQVPANAVSGNYILNVEIITDDEIYSKQKLYVEVT